MKGEIELYNISFLILKVNLHFNIYIVLVCNYELSITNEEIHFLYICTIIIRI